jgi:hypothetical protein
LKKKYRIAIEIDKIERKTRQKLEKEMEKGGK